MKNIFILFFTLISKVLFAQCTNNIMFEQFDTSSVSNPPAGWMIYHCDFTGTISYPAYSGINRIGMNDVNDTVITKILTCPNAVSFYWRASGTTSNYTVQLQTSADLINWNVIDSVTTTGSGSSTTFTQKTIALPTTNYIAPFGIYLRWRMTRRVSGTFYLDDVCVSQGNCHAVATQLQFNNMPSNCIPSNIAFGFQVCATDANGFIDTTFNSLINLSVNSGSGTLNGTLSATAIKGCAIFNNVKFSGVSPLSIKAMSGSITANSSVSDLNISATCPIVDTFKLVTYNLLNFPNGASYVPISCTTPQLMPGRWDTLKNIMNYIKPDILIVQELQTEAGADSVLNRALNVNGINYYKRAPFVANLSTSEKAYNCMLFYNNNKVGLVDNKNIKTSTRDCYYYTLFGKDPNLATHLDTTFLDVLTIHTKAKGFGAAQATLDSIRRANDCQAVMDTIRSWYSVDRNRVIGGDMNLYTSAEGCFLNLTTGTFKFNDPLNAPGAWESNASFSYLHTQATRTSAQQSLECGATGGLDSRLDFLLNSDPIMNNTKRVYYIPNTYQAVGNSANLFNKAINDASNSSGVPASVLNSMYNMSDHTPVQMKLKITYPKYAPLAIKDEIDFQGNIKDNNAYLFWQINNIQDIQQVQLMHSINNTNYFTIYEDSKVFEKNNFLNENIAQGIHYYKLKIIYKNGSIAYSQKVVLMQNLFSNGNVTPNPFHQNINVNVYHKIANQHTKYTLFSIAGTPLITGNITGLGAVSENINTESLPNGVYYLMLFDGISIQNIKLIKE